MFLLDYVSPDKALGEIEEIYNLFPEEMGPPKPLQLMSSSPGFLHCQLDIMKYFSNHQKLSFILLTAIRYLAANEFDHKSCIDFNQLILLASGATEQEVETVKSDPDKAPLDEHERAMLKFVMKVIRTPEAVKKDDVKTLHNLGWKDSEILDAAAHGTFMCGHATLMKAFSDK